AALLGGAAADSVVKDPAPAKGAEASMRRLLPQARRLAQETRKSLTRRGSVRAIGLEFRERPAASVRPPWRGRDPGRTGRGWRRRSGPDEAARAARPSAGRARPRPAP